MVDIRVLAYLLDSSRTTLNNLVLSFESCRFDEYFGESSDFHLASQRTDDFNRAVGGVDQFALAAILIEFYTPIYDNCWRDWWGLLGLYSLC